MIIVFTFNGAEDFIASSDKFIATYSTFSHDVKALKTVIYGINRF